MGFVGEKLEETIGEAAGENLAPASADVDTPEDLFASGEHVFWGPPTTITNSGADVTGWTDNFSGSSNDLTVPGNAPLYQAADGPGGTACITGDRINSESIRALTVGSADIDIDFFGMIRVDEWVNNRVAAHMPPIILRIMTGGQRFRSNGSAGIAWTLDSTIDPAGGWVGVRGGYSDSGATAWLQVQNETTLEATGLTAGSVTPDVALLGSNTDSQHAGVSVAHWVVTQGGASSAQIAGMAAYFNDYHSLSTELTWS